MGERQAGPSGAEEAAAWFREHFRPESAQGVVAVIEVELTGPDGGSLCLQFEDARLETSLGCDAAPDARVVLSSEDWRAIVAGRANAEMLAMEGRLRSDGDLGLVMKLRSLFRRKS